MKSVYLDYAAATPMDKRVKQVMEPFFTQDFYNPSSTYLAGRNVRRQLEQARSSVAGRLGAKNAEIIFTAGATEANNLAIQGVMSSFPSGEVLVSAIEHESVLGPAKLQNHKIIRVNKDGSIDLEDLQKKISAKTVLISIGLVNNELGTIQNLSGITKILNKSRNLRKNNLPLYLHTDAAQAPNFLDTHVSRLGVDLMSINGGKIYGPKQSGVLFIKAKTKLQPLIVGGGQEMGVRSGTENVAAAIGLAKALEIAQVDRKSESLRITSLRKLMIDLIGKVSSSARINGKIINSAPHILSVTFPGSDNERLMMQLDESGVAVAIGSACSASSEDSSHVLSAIGLSDSDARSTLRFSFGRQNNEDDIYYAAKALKKFL